MVRLKSRYLLVQILYPSQQPPTSTSTSSTQPATATATATLLTFHAPTPDTITPHHLLHTLRTTIHSLFGDAGAGAVAAGGLSIKYWSNATSMFVVRCGRGCEGVVGGGLCFVRTVGGGGGRGGRGVAEGEERECVMRVVRVSGTVRKCVEEAVGRDRDLCGRVRGEEGRGLVGGRGGGDGSGSGGGESGEDESDGVDG